MKKTILFHYSVFNIGGAERSLMRLMHRLVDEGWEVTLVLNLPGGTLESALDERIVVKHLRLFSAGVRFRKAEGVKKLLALGDLLLYGIDRIVEKVRRRIFRRRKYDAAVIGLHGLDASFVCRDVRASRRFHWIRNDLRFCDPERKAQRNIRRYRHCIDRYLCVSNTAKESLVELFPELETKALTLYNLIDADEMRRKAREGEAPEMHSMTKLPKVVTVCRLSDKAKGLLRMVRVHKRLDNEGIDFRWFIVGDGPDRQRMQQAIDEAGLGDKMILLGSRNNPFPYYRAADLSATLSYYEGLCGTVNEAKIMGKAVIATEFSGIREQLEHGKTGWIVRNEEDAIVEGMKTLLTDKPLREKLSNDILPEAILDDTKKIDLLERMIRGEY
jgi:glycosyltransferase involved in cell wall biosynthesis